MCCIAMSGPVPQFMPIENISKFESIVYAVSISVPKSIVPSFSIVTETIIGISLFNFLAVSLTANIAAFNCKTSCAVSRSIISTPPSIKPLAAKV